MFSRPIICGTLLKFTYLLYRFLEPPGKQLAETTNMPKKGGHVYVFPLTLNFRGVSIRSISGV